MFFLLFITLDKNQIINDNKESTAGIISNNKSFKRIDKSCLRFSFTVS